MDWTLRGDLSSVATGINYRRWAARQAGQELVAIRLGPLHYLRYCQQQGIEPPLPDGYGHGRPPVPIELDPSIGGIVAVTRPLGRPPQDGSGSDSSRE